MANGSSTKRKDAQDGVESTIDAASNTASDMIESATTAAANINEKLKTVGVDTSVMADVAKEQMTDLQRLLADELKQRPMRTLGIAAAVGFVAALIATR